MRNRAAINLCTLGPATLERKLYAASTAGFSAVGLSPADLKSPEERGMQELRLSELAVAELGAIRGWMDPGHTARTVALMQAEGMFAIAADIGAGVVIAWPSDEPLDTLVVASCFADLCRAAEPFGVRVGLEFLGNSATIRDLAAAWEIVEMAQAANGGLVIDTFHFFRGGSSITTLEELPGEKILLVQVSDAPDLPRKELADQHRLYPGAGALALERLLAAIRAKEYQGYYSLELHNEEYWEEDPIVVATEGFRSMRRMDLI